MQNPFRYFNSSPEVIRLTVMMYIRYPLSLRQVEDLLFERGIDICHETVRFLWNRFGPMFASEIRKRRGQNHSYSRWRWHLDEGVRADQRRDALPLAGRRSRRRGARGFRHCQRRSKSTPLASVKMHHLMRFSPALAVVPVVHRRDPRCFV